MSNNTYLDNDADTDTDSEDESFIYHDDGLNILGQENDNHDILNEAFIQEDVDQGPLTIEDLNTDHVDPDESETDDELDISFGGKKKTTSKKKTAKKKTAKKKTASKKKTAKKKKTTKKKTATKKKKTSTKKKGLLGLFMGGKNKKKQQQFITPMQRLI